MKILNYIFTGLIFFITIVSKTSFAIKSEKPDWVLTGASGKYDQNNYIIGIGKSKSSGDKLKDEKLSDDDSYFEIVKQILINVKGESKSSVSEYISHNISANEELYTSSIKLTSEINLPGIRIAERYFDIDEDINYSLSVLDLKSSINVLENIITNYIREYDTFSDLVSSDPGEFLIITNKYQHVSNSYEEALKINSIFNILKQKRAGKSEDYLIENPYDIIVNYYSNIGIENINSEKELEFESDNSQGNKVILQALYKKTIPVSGIKFDLVLKDGTCNISLNSETNSEGIANIIVNQLSSENNEVKLFVKIENVDDELLISKSLIVSLKKKFGLKNISAFIDITQTGATSENRLNLIQIQLENKLSESGVIVNTSLENSRLLIKGNLSTTYLNETNGILIYSLSGNIEILDSETRQIILNQSIADVKGMGITKEQAIINSYNNFIKKYFTELLNNINSKSLN